MMDLVTGKYKRRFVTCVEEDRISNLPEHLIDSILERLPVQDAVKTSILSKKWRYAWATMKELVFDEHFWDEIAQNRAFGCNRFIRIINQVLFLHEGPILKFHLHIPPNIFLDSFQEVDQWMSLLSRNSVMELILSTNPNQRYELPSHVFSCLKLRKLKLENCFFIPPFEFKGFLNLEELALWNIDFGANWGGSTSTQINLPQLKKLSLFSCTNVYNFNIKATKMWCLIAFTCPDAMLHRLLHSPCLTRFAIGDLDGRERMNLDRVLSNMCEIKTFVIYGNVLKFLSAENVGKCPINSLKCLGLRRFRFGDLDQLHGALSLLRNSPNLERLILTSLEMELQVDVGPASNHLESPNCLDCTLNQLHTVRIESLGGSRPELLFRKLLLAHSPSLKKFTIKPSGTLDAQKSFGISKDVMRFPRASPKAEVIYFNPEP